MVELNATRRPFPACRAQFINGDCARVKRTKARQVRRTTSRSPSWQLRFSRLPHRWPSRRSRFPIRKPCASAAKSGRTNAAEPWPVSLPGTQEKTSPRSASDTSSGTRPGCAGHLRKVSLALSATWNGAEQNCPSNCLGGITGPAPGIRGRNFSLQNRARE